VHLEALSANHQISIACTNVVTNELLKELADLLLPLDLPRLAKSGRPLGLNQLESSLDVQDVHGAIPSQDACDCLVERVCSASKQSATVVPDEIPDASLERFLPEFGPSLVLKAVVGTSPFWQ
jgi:hypothetical protein